MKIVTISGSDRVIDLIQPRLQGGVQLDLVTGSLSLFAFAAIIAEAFELKKARIVLPPERIDLAVLGPEADRAARNRLQSRWIAQQLILWLQAKVEIRRASASIPPGTFVVRSETKEPLEVLLGSLAFSTEGLGLTPGNPLNLIQASETPGEAALLSKWFDFQWAAKALR